jgi:hypothetical protein
LICDFLTLFSSNDLFLSHITFVCKKDFLDVSLCMHFYLPYPIRHIFKTNFWSAIIC